MGWATAQSWIAAMNTANYLGVSNWRLPAVNPVDGSSFDYTYRTDGSSDVGFNISAPGSASSGSTGSEMAHLFYNTLGNTGYRDFGGNEIGCAGSWGCLTNTGPFSNLEHYSGWSGYTYWSGTSYAPNLTYCAWAFQFNRGSQYDEVKAVKGGYAWAVSPGDQFAATVVPVPAGLWMLGSALGVLGLVRRKMPIGNA